MRHEGSGLRYDVLGDVDHSPTKAVAYFGRLGDKLSPATILEANYMQRALGILGVHDEVEKPLPIILFDTASFSSVRPKWPNYEFPSGKPIARPALHAMQGLGFSQIACVGFELGANVAAHVAGSRRTKRGVLSELPEVTHAVIADPVLLRDPTKRANHDVMANSVPPKDLTKIVQPDKRIEEEAIRGSDIAVDLRTKEAGRARRRMLGRAAIHSSLVKTMGNTVYTSSSVGDAVSSDTLATFITGHASGTPLYGEAVLARSLT